MTAPRPRTRPNPLAALAALTAAREAMKAAQEAFRLQRIAFLDSLGLKVDPTSDPQVLNLTERDWNVRTKSGFSVLIHTRLEPGYAPFEEIVYECFPINRVGPVVYKQGECWFILTKTRKSPNL